MVGLDELDERLLLLLQGDGRCSIRALAKKLGIPESSCRERVRRLERSRIILGYRAVVAKRAANTLEAWADISLADLPLSVVRSLIELTQRTSTVASASQMSGAYDYLLCFAAPNESYWTRFCAELERIGVDSSRIKVAWVAQKLKHAEQA